MLSVAWPEQTKPDVEVLATDMGTLINDLTALPNANSESRSNALAQFSSDATRATTASSEVRVDLGLPIHLL